MSLGYKNATEIFGLTGQANIFRRNEKGYKTRAEKESSIKRGILETPPQILIPFQKGCLWEMKYSL